MKHLHITLAAISVLLFAYRFLLMFIDTEKLNKKWLKILPHVIDTLLLTVGIGLAVKLGFNPTEHMWLAEKLIAIAAYIFTAYYTLKLARNKAMKILGFLGAIGWIMLALRLAMSKEALFFI